MRYSVRGKNKDNRFHTTNNEDARSQRTNATPDRPARPASILPYCPLCRAVRDAWLGCAGALCVSVIETACCIVQALAGDTP